MRRSFLPGLAVLVTLTAGCGSSAPLPRSVDIVPYKGSQQASSGDVASIELPKESSSPGAAPPNAKQETGSASASPPAAATGPEPGAPAEDPALVFHQIPPEIVIAVVKPVQSKVKACFNDGLKRDPSIEGEVRVRFVITHEGAMIDAKDDGSSMPDEEVTTCIATIIKTLKFEKQVAPGGAFGVYSIHLQH